MDNIKAAYAKFNESRFPLPSEKQVKNLEQRLRVSLPNGFRRFILEYNGGNFTEPRIVPTAKGCPTDRLTVLNGIGATHPSAELGVFVDNFDDNYPCQILPIGYTLMGNLLFVITHKKDNGCVGLKMASSDKSFLLAPGINEFFACLHEPPKDE